MLGQELYYMLVEEEEILKALVHQATLEEELQTALTGEPSEVEEKKNVRTDAHTANGSLPHHSEGRVKAEGGEQSSLGVPHHHMDEFADQHHLTKSQVEGLFMVLGPQYSNPGRRAPLKDFVITSLVVLSTKNNYRELNESKLFKSRGWMHKTIHLFCRLVVTHLSHIIEWPSEGQARDTMAHFEGIAGLPGVVGALDTCHMAITKAPVGRNSKLYSNAMLFHSIHLLAVADPCGRFTYVNVGRPGSFHEAKVLSMTSLHQMMQDSPGSLFPPNSHLVGDSAFPLTDYIITPYPVGSSTSREHRNFNAKIYRTREPVERAFQVLRARWKRLRCLEMDEVSSMSQLVRCCCILHNIASCNEGYMSLTDMDVSVAAEDGGAAGGVQREDLELEYIGTQTLSALQKRDMLAAYVNGQTITLNIQ